MNLLGNFSPGVMKIGGTIDRRMLVNFRCDPKSISRMLPAPLRPKLVRGRAIAGLCLIRLRHIRPLWLPEWMGTGSENIAHRISVEWDEAGGQRHGVFILRRDTSSALNQAAGGRLFPGTHHRADFEVWESALRYKIAMRSNFDGTFVRVVARSEGGSMSGSLFASLEEASDFFAGGSLGWSLGRNREFEGLELTTEGWSVSPLLVERVESTLFGNRETFPPGTIAFDCALLMRNIRHQWRPRSWTADENEPRTLYES